MQTQTFPSTPNVVPLLTRVLPLAANADSLLEQARTAKSAKNKSAYKTACEDWLRAERGIEVGDVVKLQFVGEAREVLVERFELHWPTGQDISRPTLVFEGPTVRLKPKRVAQTSNWFGVDGKLTRQVGPSPFLKDGLANVEAA